MNLFHANTQDHGTTHAGEEKINPCLLDSMEIPNEIEMNYLTKIHKNHIT